MNKNIPADITENNREELYNNAEFYDKILIRYYCKERFQGNENLKKLKWPTYKDKDDYYYTKYSITDGEHD